MKQIKRYNIRIKQNVANYFADCGNIIQSEQEDENGDWCRYEDVQSLEKENDELRKYKNGWKRLDKLINGILSDLIAGKITDNEAIMMQVCTKIRDHYRQLEKELGI